MVQKCEIITGMRIMIMMMIVVMMKMMICTMIGAVNYDHCDL